MRELDKRPIELMIVEEDNSTDPYNSPLPRKFTKQHTAFILEGRVVVGDTRTRVRNLYNGKIDLCVM